jgi:hypothetical protein
MMIEIHRKSPNEARQGPVPTEYEHGRAQGEKILVQPSHPELTKGKEVVIGEQ